MLAPLLPNAFVANAYLSRGIRLWIAVRLLVSAVYLLGGASPVQMWRSGSIALVAVTALLTYVDLGVRKERALIANLGMSVAGMVAICSAPALAGEIIITLVGRLV